MSVFVGPWDLDAAAPVTGLPATRAVDVLDSLVAKSLVTTERAEDGRTRYRLLETIRQFAQEKLVEAGEVEGARDRHARHYAGLAGAAAGSVLTLTPVIGANEENVLGAIEWLQGRDGAAAVDLAILALVLPEAAKRALPTLERFAGLENEAAATRARARAFLPHGLLMAGRFFDAVALALDGLSQFRQGPTVEHFAVRHALAMLLAATNPEASLRHATRSEEIYSELRAEERAFVGHTAPGGISSPGALALVHMREYDKAIEWMVAREGLSGSDERGLIAVTGVALHLTGDHAAAAFRAEGLLQQRGQVRFGFGYVPEQLLACCLAGMGETDRAGRVLVELARSNRIARIPLGVSDAVTAFARVRFLSGELERARTLLRCAVTRTVPMTPVLCETFAALEDWPDDEFVARMQQRVTELNRPERLETVDREAWPLLLEEIAYFSGLADPASTAGVS
jgi:hypothetical protein